MALYTGLSEDCKVALPGAAEWNKWWRKLPIIIILLK